MISFTRTIHLFKVLFSNFKKRCIVALWHLPSLYWEITKNKQEQERGANRGWVAGGGGCRRANRSRTPPPSFPLPPHETTAWKYCLSSKMISDRLKPTIYLIYLYIFNRPGKAGAVLWTPLWFIYSLVESSFCSEISRHFLSQTVRAWKLKFWENVHTSPGVRCHVWFFFFFLCSLFFMEKVVELVGGGSVINEAYPV